MTAHALVAIVTLLALILYLIMGFNVGRARAAHGVVAPATSGNEDFERVFRVHANTLEWMPLFLVSLWLFALYWDDTVAAALGAVWIVGRVLYMTGYTRAANARSMGFLIQFLAVVALMLGALGRIVYILVTKGV